MSRTPQLVVIDGKKIQATTKDEPEYGAEVVEHSVERGSNISDSVKPKLVHIDLDGVVSEVKGLGDTTLSPDDFHSFMEALMESRRPVAISCPRWSFDSMVCESYKPKRRGGAISFSSKWKEYRVVNSRQQVVKVVLGQKAKKGPVPGQVIEPVTDEGLLAVRLLGPSGTAQSDATASDLKGWGPNNVAPASPSAASRPEPTLTDPFSTLRGRK